jgi:hypothetical protein
VAASPRHAYPSDRGGDSRRDLAPRENGDGLGPGTFAYRGRSLLLLVCRFQCRRAGSRGRQTTCSPDTTGTGSFFESVYFNRRQHIPSPVHRDGLLPARKDGVRRESQIRNRRSRSAGPSTRIGDSRRHQPRRHRDLYDSGRRRAGASAQNRSLYRGLRRRAAFRATNHAGSDHTPGAPGDSGTLDIARAVVAQALTCRRAAHADHSNIIDLPY